MAEHGLKRHFDGGAARLLGQMLHEVCPGFDVDGYVDEVRARIPPLELKGRVGVLAEGLRARLPADYPDAVAALLAILGDELGESDGMFRTGWYLMPVARFVEEYGLDHPDLSLDAIHEITRRHTGEYAIRPYLREHHERTMDRVRRWALSPSANVRRLASEGIRPRLPWARMLTRFVENPHPVVEVLEPLRSDPSAYVRRSVANNLNDIARDHPELVLGVLERWTRESDTAETARIARHAVRVLVKNGNRRALALCGGRPAASIRVRRIEPKRVHTVLLGRPTASPAFPRSTSML